jgi:hypothetical protein
MRPILHWKKSKAEAYAPGAAPKGQSMITKRDLVVAAVNRGVRTLRTVTHVSQSSPTDGAHSGDSSTAANEIAAAFEVYNYHPVRVVRGPGRHISYRGSS